MDEVVGEVLLDHVALVAKAQHEVANAMVRVDLHDVPKNGLAADLDHRLGANLRLFADSRSQSTSENDRFHD